MQVDEIRYPGFASFSAGYELKILIEGSNHNFHLVSNASLLSLSLSLLMVFLLYG